MKIKQTIKKWAKEILIMTILLTVSTNIISYIRAPKLQTQNIPSFNVKLTNQEQFNTKKLSGKAVLIHFWATWCPTCKLESSNIEKISKKYKAVTVAVNSGSNKDIEKYLKDRDLTFNVINDKNGTLSHKFSVSAFPTTFIYNKKGELLFSEVGYTSTIGLYIRMWYASL